MAISKIVIDGSNSVSARQLKDLFRQIDEELISGPMLQDFLEKRNPFRKIWKVWKTIEIGKYQGYWDIRPSLESKGYTVDSSSATCIIDCLYLSAKKSEKVNLALVSMEDLGFSEDDYAGMIPLADVLKRALKLGLTYCLPEDTPALREQYANQPLMDYIRMGMIPVVDPHDSPTIKGKCIFVLNGKNIHCDSADFGVSMTHKFVFRICK